MTGLSQGRSVCLASLELPVSPSCTSVCVSLKFIEVARTKAQVAQQLRSDTAAQGNWELLPTSFKDCFYYTLEPICQSIEAIMTKGLLIELNEPSKQIKIMKHLVLPNRQASVPQQDSSLAGELQEGEGNACKQHRAAPPRCLSSLREDASSTAEL